jgi:hypothetical protein
VSCSGTSLLPGGGAPRPAGLRVERGVVGVEQPGHVRTGTVTVDDLALLSEPDELAKTHNEVGRNGLERGAPQLDLPVGSHLGGWPSGRRRRSWKPLTSARRQNAWPAKRRRCTSSELAADRTYRCPSGSLSSYDLFLELEAMDLSSRSSHPSPSSRAVHPELDVLGSGRRGGGRGTPTAPPGVFGLKHLLWEGGILERRRAPPSCAARSDERAPEDAPRDREMC